MNRQGYLKVVATLILIAVVFFGLMLVNSLDRLRRGNQRLADQLARLSERLDGGRPDSPSGARAVQPDVAGGAVANLEYFDPAAVPGDRLVQAAAAETQNMNDLINNDAYVANFHAIANSSLAGRNYGDPDKFEPLLAESWRISPDRKSFHIQLRRGVYWHDFTDPVTGKEWKNREVTADDFRFRVEVIKNPDVNCEPLRVYFQDLDRVEVLNDYEFIVHWSRSTYGSLAVTFGLSPLPRHLYHAYEGPFDGRKFNEDYVRNRILIGCGPYRFDRWEKDVRVVFRRHENYFGNRLGIRPPIDTQVFELIKLPNTRFQALLAGQLDQLNLTEEQWVERTNRPEFADGRLAKHKFLARKYNYIGYNLRNPLFADRRVRRALTMLIDRERILREVMFGLGEVISGPFFPGSAYHNPAIQPLPYDVARAKALLAEAGWRDTDGDGILDKDGRKFVFSIMQLNISVFQQKALPMIKESLAQAGIDLRIEMVEWSVLLQRLEQRKFDSCILAWSMPPDPDPYQVWHSSQADLPRSSNHIGFKNEEVDRLIEELRITFDPARRVEITHRIGEILHEEQPYTFLTIPCELSVFSGRYRNVRIFQLGIPTDIIWTPKESQLTFH